MAGNDSFFTSVRERERERDCGVGRNCVKKMDIMLERVDDSTYPEFVNV